MINCRLATFPTILLNLLALCALRVYADVGAPLPPEQPGAAAPGAPLVPAPAPTPVVNPNLPPRPQQPENSLKSSPALLQPQLAKIDSFVKDSITRMVGATDGTSVAEARSDLVAGSASAPQTPNSNPYITQYIASLASALQQPLQHGTLNQRINCGIVMTRVAENATQVGVPLQPLYHLIVQELQDPSDAIAIWGMKAAAVALNAAPGVPGQVILREIIPSVQKHRYNGAITEEAYAALSDADSQVIATLMQLYKDRIAQYANGLPDDPSVDRRAASHFVTQGGMWAKMDKAQQDQAMDLVRQNLDAATKAIAAADAQSEAVNQLRMLIIDTCKAVIVAATARNEDVLRADASMVARLDRASSPSDVVARVTPVIAGLQTAFPPTGAGAQAGSSGDAAGLNPAAVANH